jgi:hypothetical protein
MEQDRAVVVEWGGLDAHALKGAIDVFGVASRCSEPEPTL